MGIGIGETVDGRYLLKREVARTARNIIYEGEHLLTRRPVAIKIPASRGAHGTENSELLLAEARILTEARHPCVVDVLDAGKLRAGALATQTLPYLAMEMLEARSLTGLLTTRAPLSVMDSLRIALPVCDALVCIHRNGVVHGDLRPDNIFVQRSRLGAYDPPIRLVGFGAAARALLGIDDDVQASPGEDGYRAPELHDGDEATAASDIFSLAVIVYESLTGKLPFEGAEQTPPMAPMVVRDDVPEHISVALMEALERTPAKRIADAGSFSRALRPRKTAAARVQVAAPASDTASERSQAVTDSSAAKPVAKETSAPEAAPLVPEPGKPMPRLLDVPPAETRRRYRRASYLTAARVIRDGDTAFDTRCEDISEGGLLLIGPHLVQNGETIQVRFGLPVTGEVLTVKAEARWHRAAREGRGAIGVQFIDLPESARSLIAQYVEFFS